MFSPLRNRLYSLHSYLVTNPHRSPLDNLFVGQLVNPLIFRLFNPPEDRLTNLLGILHPVPLHSPLLFPLASLQGSRQIDHPGILQKSLMEDLLHNLRRSLIPDLAKFPLRYHLVNLLTIHLVSPQMVPRRFQQCSLRLFLPVSLLIDLFPLPLDVLLADQACSHKADLRINLAPNHLDVPQLFQLEVPLNLLLHRLVLEILIIRL